MAWAFNILVGTIPVRGRSVLVLQRSLSEKFMPGAWGLPCGKIEYGETLEAAARRELREESGLEGEIGRMVGYSMFMSTKGGQKLHNLQVNFVVHCDDGDIRLDKSSEAFRWIDFAHLDEADLDEFTLDTIRQAGL